MLSSPRVGDVVQIWYARRAAVAMPHHGRSGTVVTVATGRPRNHGVRLIGSKMTITVPAGNLRRLPDVSKCRLCARVECHGSSHLCYGCGYIVCDACCDDHGHVPGGAHELSEAPVTRRVTASAPNPQEPT